jgi:hypothetical protein
MASRSLPRGVGLLLWALAAMVLAGCGSGQAAVDTQDDAVTDGEAAGGTALAGELTGYITATEAGALTLDEIEVLSGDAAATAREEDGEPPVEDGVDIPYLRNPTAEAYEIDVAPDVQVRVYDCASGCEFVDWDYDDLVSGTPLPYGSSASPFTVTVHDGEVVEIAEVYLP